jgi:hypothetical protein
MSHHINLATITLTAGAHDYRADGTCLMEAVAWFAGEEHTDRPACVSQSLGFLGRALNDLLPHDDRQELVAAIPHLPGTADDGYDMVREYMVAEWLFRECLPVVYAAAEPSVDADTLRTLIPPITGPEAVRKGGAAVLACRQAIGWMGDGDFESLGTSGDEYREAAWQLAVAVRRVIEMDDGFNEELDTAVQAAMAPIARAAEIASARGTLGPAVDSLRESVVELYYSMATIYNPATPGE